MPNPLHIRLAAVAERLIGSHGRAMTLRRRNATPPDVNRPWEPPPEPTVDGADQVPLIGAQFDYTQSEKRDSQIEAHDVRFFFDANTAPGDIGVEWEIEDTGCTFQIIHVMPIKPGEVPVVYDVQARA